MPHAPNRKNNKYDIKLYSLEEDIKLLEHLEKAQAFVKYDKRTDHIYYLENLPRGPQDGKNQG